MYKPIHELTRLGKIRRGHKYVSRALADYDLEVKTVRFLTEESNMFFKVVDQNGNKYAAKLYENFSSNLMDSRLEMYLLNYINDMTQVGVPSPLKNKSGESITLLEDSYEDVQPRVALYKWFDGQPFEGQETVEYFYEIGQVMAQMHQATKNLSYPKDLKPKKIDKVFYYAGDQEFYKMDKYKSFVSQSFKSTMDYLVPILDQKLKAYYQEEAILIHADFNPWNIWVDKGIKMIDFEDASLGLPLHDIAILLYYYRFHENYESFKEAFYQGYETLLPLPSFNQEDLDTLMTARDANFINYILVLSDDPSDYIDKQLKRLKTYIDTYLK